jgi:3-phosphoshikimate 1-carboxyvinyltransferase
MATPRTILPIAAVDGSMRVPGSKSIANRALVCAALAQGRSVIRNMSDSTDTAMMINGLDQMGVLATATGTEVHVTGTGGVLFAPKFPIPVGNAGTTLRFMISVAARAKGTTSFDGSERMAGRPITPLVDALAGLGVRVEVVAPMSRYSVHGGTWKGGRTSVSGEKSSQFVSSLLLAAPGLEDGLMLDVPGVLSSAPYVGMTLRVMNAFGVEVQLRDNGFSVDRDARYKGTSYVVEADASGATYPFAAVALCGGVVRVPDLARDSMQSDAGFIDVMCRMGCTVRWEEGAAVLERTGDLHGIEVDMNAMPDAVPALVAVALFATGPTRIRNVAHLRFKESDRLGTLAEQLRLLGAEITVLEDGLDIHPGPLHGAQLDPHEDHRLAMMFGLIGLRIPGVVVEDPDCVRKSYPRFWDELTRLSHSH